MSKSHFCVQILKLSVVVTKLGDKPIVGLEKPGQLTDHIWSALMSFCKERPFFTVLCDHTKKFHRHMRRDWRGWIWKSCGCPPGLTDLHQTMVSHQQCPPPWYARSMPSGCTSPTSTTVTCVKQPFGKQIPSFEVFLEEQNTDSTWKCHCHL